MVALLRRGDHCSILEVAETHTIEEETVARDNMDLLSWLRKQLAEANDKVIEAQKQRVEDAKAIAEKLIEMSSEHAGLTKETNLALDRVG